MRSTFVVLAVALQIVANVPINQKVSATGTVQAVRSILLTVPSIAGGVSGVTIVNLVGNRAVVHKGDLVAQFDHADHAKEVRLLLDGEAKLNELARQIAQKAGEHAANAEKRASDFKQAKEELQEAQLEIRRGLVLSDIDQQKNALRFELAQAHVSSLNRSSKFHDQAEAAEGCVLDLRREHERLIVDRQKTILDKFNLRAPAGGVVALESISSHGSLRRVQVGDLLWPGRSLMRIFDPSAMDAMVEVGEPARALLVTGVRAVVRPNAFPGLTLPAHFDSATPVATSGSSGPDKKFLVRFRIDQSDPRLLTGAPVTVDIEIQPKRMRNR